jgi:hypothetical protein
MGANIIGKHLHIDPAEKGRVIWITAKKDGALYVSYFPDEQKHFLTIRDGVHFDFRDLDPKVKMHNPKDRLFPLALHYRDCWDAAAIAMAGVDGGMPKDFDLTPVATALWIETKAGVTVPPSEPIKQPEEPPAPEPAPPEEKEEEEDPAVRLENHIKVARAEYERFEPFKICVLAAAAMKYKGDNIVALAKKTALTRLVDDLKATGSAKIWMEVYDALWNSLNEEHKKIIDDGVAICFEKKPGISDSDAHRIVCLSYIELVIASEKI